MKLNTNARNLQKTVETMVKTFKKERINMGKELHAELMSHINEIKRNADITIKGFRTDRELSSKELKRELKTNAKNLQKNVDTMIKTFQKERISMGKDLHAELMSYIGGIKMEVGDLLETVDKEMAGMYKEWLRVARIKTQSKGLTVEPKEFIKEILPPEVKEEILAVKEEAKNETPEDKGEKMEPPSQKETLENPILFIVSQHGEGITLPNIGEEMGKEWRGLIRHVKTLLNEGKLIRDDNRYLMA